MASSICITAISSRRMPEKGRGREGGHTDTCSVHGTGGAISVLEKAGEWKVRFRNKLVILKVSDLCTSILPSPPRTHISKFQGRALATDPSTHLACPGRRRKRSMPACCLRPCGSTAAAALTETGPGAIARGRGRRLPRAATCTRVVRHTGFKPRESKKSGFKPLWVIHTKHLPHPLLTCLLYTSPSPRD